MKHGDKYFDSRMNKAVIIKTLLKKKEAGTIVIEGKTISGISNKPVDYKPIEYDAKSIPWWPLLKYDGTIGSDPEIFVKNDTGIIPAFNFLKSKKDMDAFTCDHNAKINHIYWDGFQAEFDTQSQYCLQMHNTSVWNGLRGVYTKALAYDKKATLSIDNIVEIDSKLIESGADEHVQFGCMPSMNAYGMSGMFVDGRATNLRCAGGHVHFGYSQYEFDPVACVEALDAVIGVACVSLFRNIDKPERHNMYGLAGEYRLPNHGMEYRTLSNAWLCHPLVMHLVIDLARTSFMFGKLGFLNKCWKGTRKETIDIINSCNVPAAVEMLQRNEAVLKKLINVAYVNESSTERAYGAFLNGVESIIEDPSNVIGNWNLKESYRGQYESNYSKRCEWCHAQEILKTGKKIGAAV